MIEKNYKDANDDINTNRQLIDNIFETSTTTPKEGKRVALYRYGAAVAAVFVVVFAAIFYDDIIRTNTEESVPQMARAVPESPQGDMAPFSRNIEGEPQNEFAVKIDDFVEVPETQIEEKTEALIQRFGEKDKETGNMFIFEIVGRAEVNEKGYYLGRWKWFVVDHSSLLTEFVLNEEMTGMYECVQNAETGDVVWNETINLFQ